MPVLDPPIQAIADRLLAASEAQDAAMGPFFQRKAAAGELNFQSFDDETHRFLADKYVALEADKAEFAYLVARSLKARRIVEVGTSYGMSTLYLAQAIRDNGGGTVIATEYEPAKAAQARANFAEAGLAPFIDLREGDLRETLKVIEGDVDFVLMDIWTEMARTALERIHPHLRPGAVILTDNTAGSHIGYQDYFEFVRDPKNGLITNTLPFKGGLEFTVRA